ncbi:hypothetical protein PoB_002754400 [Plakobranchus ocellatus]|uniref:Uncharacterized protein n=1 Tax=Plakobranchus ocellatus TaxID=259542 RepID=A0AAV4A0C1_9GAST|nr:hypothetical protein PoB_002754400 [Plakobranchus ocellatus]
MHKITSAVCLRPGKYAVWGQQGCSYEACFPKCGEERTRSLADWLTWSQKICTRHQDLSLRQPGATSIDRASGFKRGTVESYSKKMESIIDCDSLSVGQKFSMGEPVISVIHKVLSHKEKYQV